VLVIIAIFQFDEEVSAPAAGACSDEPAAGSAAPL